LGLGRDLKDTLAAEKERVKKDTVQRKLNTKKEELKEKKGGKKGPGKLVTPKKRPLPSPKGQGESGPGGVER